MERVKTIWEERVCDEQSPKTGSNQAQLQSSSFSGFYKSCQSKSDSYQKLLAQDVNFRDKTDLSIVLNIIEKENYLKTHTDLRILQNAFKNIKLFSELANEIPQNQLFNLYRELRHVFYPSRKVIFNQGELGKEFYIILKGFVHIIGNEDKQKTAHPPKQTEPSKNIDFKPSYILNKRYSMKKKSIHSIRTHSDTLSSSSSPLEPHHSHFRNLSTNNNNSLLNVPIVQIRKSSFPTEQTDEDFIRTQYPDFDILVKLEPGQSFGEVALKNNVPRYAHKKLSLSYRFQQKNSDCYLLSRNSSYYTQKRSLSIVLRQA